MTPSPSPSPNFNGAAQEEAEFLLSEGGHDLSGPDHGNNFTAQESSVRTLRPPPSIPPNIKITANSSPTTSVPSSGSKVLPQPPGHNPSSASSSPRPGHPPHRHSSLTRPRSPNAPKTPRTANRVRFDLSPTIASTPPSPVSDPAYPHKSINGGLHPNGGLGINGGATSPSRSPPVRAWFDDGDPLGDASDVPSSGGRLSEGRERLLEGMEAGSVTAALDMDEGSEEGWQEGDGEYDWEREARRPKSGLRSAFMNMANSIIGAGIIGQPYAFRQAGLMAGIVLLVGLTITVDWTIRLIVINSKLSGANTFQATMEHCFGKPGLIAISVAQWVFAFGGMVAFCVIVGDTIPHVLTAIAPKLPETPLLWVFSDRRFIIVLFILGISYPLSLYRDIAKLAKASTLALISMLVIIVTVITQGAKVDPEMKGPIVGSLGIKGGIFQAIGVISFAFVCHHNSLLIYGSLKKPTIDRFARVTHYSTGISMLACLAMALAGFLTFGDKTLGNVLNNFPADNVMVNIARLCFGLNMLTTLPLETFVCREVLLTYFYPHSPHSTPRHLIMTTALVLSATLLSLLTCDLGAVFELIGATSACALAYILPPLCYIRLSTRSWKTVLAWGVVCFGVTVMGISTVLTVGKMAGLREGTKGETCS